MSVSGAVTGAAKAPVASPPGVELPVASVLVDLPLPHLDRPFDYAVPPELAATAVPGARVRVRLAGQDLAGFVLERCAGTDFAGHRRFLEQAEAYRYALVQRLNRMQAEAVSYSDDTATDANADRRKRVAADNWEQMPDFTYRAPSGAALAAGALPGLAIVLGWLVIAGLLLVRASRRLGESR